MKLPQLSASCFLLLFLGLATQTFAQTPEKSVFYIQLGLLRYPDTLQFASLKSYGKLYQEPANDLVRVLLGKYADRETATNQLNTIRQQGFKDAFLVQRQEVLAAAPSPTAVGKLFTVQIGAYKDKKTLPNTAHLEKYGRVSIVQEGGWYKLRLGLFQKEDEAKALVNRVRGLGFSKAALYVLKKMPTAPREGFLPRSDVSILQTPSFYKRMQGKMNGSQLVVVHLYYTENSFSGYYTDPNTAERKRFTYYGVNLNDKSTEKQKDVYITRFGGDSFGLSFGIKDKDTGKENTFTLTEQYNSGSAHFNIMTMYKTKIKKLNTGEIGADVFVEYPLMVEFPDAKVQQKFNALSLQFSETTHEGNLNTKIETQLQSDLNTVNKFFPKYNWLSETYENRIIENSNSLLSIRYYAESILATPKISIKHKSFNLKTGQQLLLTDLLMNNYAAELRKVLDTKFRAKILKFNKLTAAEMNTAVSEMLTNYYFTSYGIVFFLENKFGNKLPHGIEVSVPYREIKQVVKPEFLKELGIK
jgi:cell division septation protein DedD